MAAEAPAFPQEPQPTRATLQQLRIDLYGNFPIASQAGPDPAEDAQMVLQEARRQTPKKRRSAADPVGEEHAEARARLVTTLKRVLAEKGMTQVQAARLLGTDQPTLSKVLRERTASVSLDKLVSWLVTLGQSVEIRVFAPADHTVSSFTASVPGASDG